MDTYAQIIEELENELQKTAKKSSKITEHREFAIGQCMIALGYMRDAVISKGFPDKQSEIRFFKKVKPLVYSKLLYYQALFEIESTRQNTDIGRVKKYLGKKLRKILKYMEKNKQKVQYHRCNFEHFDEKYFTRGNEEIPLPIRDHHFLMDEEFFTWHDHTFSLIKANEMLIDYLQKEIGKFDNLGNDLSTNYQSPLKWTGSKVSLVELFYALQCSGMVNNGNVEIKELAKQFEKTFNVDLKDFYHMFSEIKRRKLERTKFLDFLKSSLERKIDESDK